MNERGGSCFPTTRKLTDETGLSERTVCTHLMRAAQDGWLHKTSGVFSGRHWHRSVYEATIPVEAKKKALNDVQYLPNEALNLTTRGTERRSVPHAFTQLSSINSTSNSTENICSEPKISAPAPPSSNGSGFKFPTCRKGVEWEVPERKIAEWVEAYPSVDIPQTLVEARQWLRDNPARAKTASGMTRFIGRWLQREQDK